MSHDRRRFLFRTAAAGFAGFAGFAGAALAVVGAGIGVFLGETVLAAGFGFTGVDFAAGATAFFVTALALGFGLGFGLGLEFVFAAETEAGLGEAFLLVVVVDVTALRLLADIAAPSIF